MARQERTVRESVQPLSRKQPIYQTLSAAGTAENIDVSGMEEWRKISITTDRAVYLGFDVDATAVLSDTNALRLNAGESYYDDQIRVETRLRFININPAETPTLRGIAWGE